MAGTVKLQLSLSPALVRAVRLYLAEQDRGKKGELSEFFAELARARLSEWIHKRAQATGHVADLAPERVAAAVDRHQAETRAASHQTGPDAAASAPSEQAAPPVPVVFSDDEVEALLASAQRWASH